LSAIELNRSASDGINVRRTSSKAGAPDPDQVLLGSTSERAVAGSGHQATSVQTVAALLMSRSHLLASAPATKRKLVTSLLLETKPGYSRPAQSLSQPHRARSVRQDPSILTTVACRSPEAPSADGGIGGGRSGGEPGWVLRKPTPASRGSSVRSRTKMIDFGSCAAASIPPTRGTSEGRVEQGSKLAAGRRRRTLLVGKRGGLERLLLSLQARWRGTAGLTSR